MSRQQYGQANPYAQQDTSYNPNDTYGAPNYGAQGARGTGYEMAPLNGQPYQQADNPQAFFQEISYLREACKGIQDKITTIESLHQRSLASIDEGATAQNTAELDALTAETSELNRTLASRIKMLKQKSVGDPDKAPQVGNLDRTFKDTLRRYQSVEASYQRRARDQLARQYRIVNPDATDAEIEEATENANGPVFSQAVMSNRRGAARSALNEVRSRHTEIQKIEKTMIELAQLFQDMEQLVVEQEPMVDQIDQRGQEITENTGKANEELGTAVKSARSARRKKWWCLLIAVIILIIIAVVVAVVVVTQKKN